MVFDTGPVTPTGGRRPARRMPVLRKMTAVAALATSWFASGLLFAGAALAQQPEPWGLNFQPPASPIAVQAVAFHNLLLWILTAITIFVLGLMGLVTPEVTPLAAAPGPIPAGLPTPDPERS